MAKGQVETETTWFLEFSKHLIVLLDMTRWTGHRRHAINNSRGILDLRTARGSPTYVPIRFITESVPRYPFFKMDEIWQMKKIESAASLKVISL